LCNYHILLNDTRNLRPISSKHLHEQEREQAAEEQKSSVHGTIGKYRHINYPIHANIRLVITIVDNFKL
jgi:hypothetical protein